MGNGECVGVLIEFGTGSINGTDWSGTASSSGGGRTLFRGGKAGLGDSGGGSSVRKRKSF